MNTDAMFSSKTDQWETPQDFYDELNAEFGFTLDPCADVFCNPPYGREIGSWVRKCYQHGTSGQGIAVMLVPARTDTKWFHEYIYSKNVEVRFLKGRLKFGGSKNSAPFPSMVVVFRCI